MAIHIEVKQGHIVFARRTETGNPIALAVADALSGFVKLLKWDTESGYWVTADLGSVSFETALEVGEFELPDEGKAFMRRFYRGESVSPFTLILKS